MLSTSFAQLHQPTVTVGDAAVLDVGEFLADAHRHFARGRTNVADLETLALPRSSKESPVDTPGRWPLVEERSWMTCEFVTRYRVTERVLMAYTVRGLVRKKVK